MREDNFSSIWEVSLNFTTACSEIGIKIEEGTNKAFGDGIFISDVQDGSPACLGGVQIGDMLLAVNMCDLLGASKEFTAELIRRIDGEVRLKIFSQRMDKDNEDEIKKLTPDWVKRTRQWKSNNGNNDNREHNDTRDNKDCKEENKKKNLMTTCSFDPFGSDSY